MNTSVSEPRTVDVIGMLYLSHEWLYVEFRWKFLQNLSKIKDYRTAQNKLMINQPDLTWQQQQEEKKLNTSCGAGEIMESM